MAVFLGAVQKNSNTIQRRVDEINDMIRYANSKDIEVVDTSSSWQSPMKYDLLKYTKGVLYVKFKELELYKANKGGGRDYKSVTERYGKNDVNYALTNIAKMYRKAIK